MATFRVYETGTTTANGAEDGTTVIDTNRKELDETFKNCKLKITSGVYSGQERSVTSWVKSTGTFTVSPAFGGQILSGVTYEVGIYLPKYPSRFRDTNLADTKKTGLPGTKPLIVSIGLDARTLEVEGWITEAGKTKADLETLYIFPLHALVHWTVVVSAEDTRYDGVWLLDNFIPEEIVQKYGTRSFYYRLRFIQGSRYVVL